MINGQCAEDPDRANHQPSGLPRATGFLAGALFGQERSGRGCPNAHRGHGRVVSRSYLLWFHRCAPFGVAQVPGQDARSSGHAPKCPARCGVPLLGTRLSPGGGRPAPQWFRDKGRYPPRLSIVSPSVRRGGRPVVEEIGPRRAGWNRARLRRRHCAGGDGCKEHRAAGAHRIPRVWQVLRHLAQHDEGRRCPAGRQSRRRYCRMYTW